MKKKLEKKLLGENHDITHTDRERCQGSRVSSNLSGQGQLKVKFW